MAEPCEKGEIVAGVKAARKSGFLDKGQTGGDAAMWINDLSDS